MQTRVKKWGNSLGLRIPQDLARRLGIVEDTAVEIIASDDSILIRPVRESLRDLVDQITPENRHEEIDWKSPRGNEAW